MASLTPSAAEEGENFVRKLCEEVLALHSRLDVLVHENSSLRFEVAQLRRVLQTMPTDAIADRFW